MAGWVNEVNYHGFRNSIDTTGVNIPARVIDELWRWGAAGSEYYYNLYHRQY